MTNIHIKKKIVAYVTSSRALISFYILVAYNFPKDSLLVLMIPYLFLIACCTDYFDGMLARKWNCTSLKGAVMDQICDKILFHVTFISFIGFFNKTSFFYSSGHFHSEVWHAMLVLCAGLLIMRDFFVSANRMYDDYNKHQTTYHAKCKTAILFISMVLMLFIAHYMPYDPCETRHIFIRYFICSLLYIGVYHAYCFERKEKNTSYENNI